MSQNVFSKVEADKIIKTTIDRDTKTLGGLKGHNTKINKVIRWILNATHRASLRWCFHNMINYQGSRTQRKIMNKLSHIIDTLKDTFVHPFSDNKLLCISNGLVATEDVTENLMNAKIYGEKAVRKFMNN